MSWAILVKRLSDESLQWRHNGRDSISNHQHHDCLLIRLLWHRSKKTSKLRVMGHCERKLPGTDKFPAQRASSAENVSIWWRHHDDIEWDMLLGAWTSLGLCDGRSSLVQETDDNPLHQQMSTQFYDTTCDMCTNGLTHWPLGDLDAILKLQFSILFHWLVSSELLMITHPYGWHGTSKDDKSTLVLAMAWCRQATIHYLGQCWPSFMSPNCVTGPQMS